MQTPIIVLVDKPIRVFGGYDASALTLYPRITIQREYDTPCLRAHEMVHYRQQAQGLAWWLVRYVAWHLWLTVTNVDYRKGDRRLHPMERTAYEVQYRCEAALEQPRILDNASDLTD